jgi:RNA polymerase sigma factor (sigma-70 family)
MAATGRKMLSNTPMTDLIARLRDRDETAAAEVHGRFVRRLVALACRQFEPWVRAKADHEDVVQSVFQSFFARCQRGEFAFDDWDALWNLLALITVRKCRRRRAALRAGRRDAAREVPAWSRPDEGRDPVIDALDRDPTPAEAAMLAEVLRSWLHGLAPRERAVVELGLQGFSNPEIAERLGRTERTVRRIHGYASEQLQALLLAPSG